MVDLAQVPGRTTAADRLTNNRTTVLPGQREDRVAPVQITANMANAQRGSDVEQVRQTLGIVDQGIDGLVDIAAKTFAKKETANAELAAQDQATGHPNGQLMKRSDAYRMVIADGRVSQVLAQLTIQTRQNVSDALAQHADADPTKGEQPFGLDDANRVVDDIFHGALVGEDGRAIDFGDPAANAKLYRGLAQVREDVMAKAADIIKHQEQAKALRAITTSVGADAANGVNSVEDNLAKARALGIDTEEARNQFVRQLDATAMLTEDASLLQRALESKQANGAPSFSPSQRATLLERYHTLDDYFARKHEQDAEKHSANTIGEAFVAIQAGHLRVTPDYVQGLIDSHQIRAQDGHQLFAAQEHQDDLAFQKVQRARSDQEFAWAQASNARSAQSFAWSQQEHAFTVRRQQAAIESEAIMARAYSSGMGPGETLAKLNAAYAAKKIDDVTYNAAREMARGIPDDGDMTAKYGGTQHFILLNASFKRTADLAARHTPGYMTPLAAQRVISAATVTFYDSLRRGLGPDAAMKAAYRNMGITDEKYLQQQTLTADANTRKPGGALQSPALAIGH